MGISFEQWRRCIGSFCPRTNQRESSSPNFIDSHRAQVSKTSAFILALVLGLILLLANDVETNPGPQPLKCPSCELVFTRVKHYALHQEAHFSLKNHRFPCVVDTCRELFATKQAFEIHMQRFHAPSSSSCTASTSTVMMHVECSVQRCKMHLVTRKEYTKHSYGHLSRGVAVNCAWCSKIFTSKSKFQQHVSVYHRDCSFPPASTIATPDPGTSTFSSNEPDEQNVLDLAGQQISDFQEVITEKPGEPLFLE